MLLGRFSHEGIFQGQFTVEPQDHCGLDQIRLDCHLGEAIFDFVPRMESMEMIFDTETDRIHLTVGHDQLASVQSCYPSQQYESSGEDSLDLSLRGEDSLLSTSPHPFSPTP